SPSPAPRATATAMRSRWRSPIETSTGGRETVEGARAGSAPPRGYSRARGVASAATQSQSPSRNGPLIASLPAGAREPCSRDPAPFIPLQEAPHCPYAWASTDLAGSDETSSAPPRLRGWWPDQTSSGG